MIPARRSSRQELATNHARSCGVDVDADVVAVIKDVVVDTSGTVAPVGGSAGPTAIAAEDRVLVTTHTDSDGSSALVGNCPGPVAWRTCLVTVITDLAVVDVRGGTFVLRRTAPGVTASEVVRATDGPIDIMSYLRTMASTRSREEPGHAGR